MRRWIVGSLFILGLTTPALGQSPAEPPLGQSTDQGSTRSGSTLGPGQAEVPTLRAPSRVIADVSTLQEESPTTKLDEGASAQPPEPGPGDQQPPAPDLADADIPPPGRAAQAEVRTLHAPDRAVAKASTPQEQPPTMVVAQATRSQPPEPDPADQQPTASDPTDADSPATRGPAQPEVPTLRTPDRIVAELSTSREEPLTTEIAEATPAPPSGPDPGDEQLTVLDLTDGDVPGATGEGAQAEVPTLRTRDKVVAEPSSSQEEPPTIAIAQATPAQPPEPGPGDQQPTGLDLTDGDLLDATGEGAQAELPTLRAPDRTVAEASTLQEEPPAIVVAQATPAQAPGPTPSGERLISLDFKDADLANLLRILAAESEKNIVAGEDVKGTITISLKNVTWELALDTILETQGLRKIEKNNIIRIVSLEQLAKEQEAKARAEEAKLKAEVEIRAKIAEAELKEQELKERKLAAEAARAEAEARGPLKEEMIRLSYADPEDVVETLIGILGIPPEGTVPVEPAALTGPTPAAPQPQPGLFGALYGGSAPQGPSPISISAEVLAKGITIRAHKPTNSVFIRHFEADLERIKKLIREDLDVPLPQVKIEARMEILEREDLFAIGVEWGGGVAQTVGSPTLIGQGFSPRAPVRPVTIVGTGADDVGQENPNLNLTEFFPVDPATGLPTGGNLINLPIAALLGGAASVGGGGFLFGIVGKKLNINLALEALRTEGKTETLARPEVVTVENNKATISLGEEIPFATISLEGTKIEFKEALLKLDVTPTVIKEGDINRIKMKVIVENNSRAPVTVDLGTAGAPPVINKRRAETEVLIKEGDHLVIGGVTQTTAQEQLRKVPLLGDIPVLGWLFKQRGTQDASRELVVFITPTVVERASGERPEP